MSMCDWTSVFYGVNDVTRKYSAKDIERITGNTVWEDYTDDELEEDGLKKDIPITETVDGDEDRAREAVETLLDYIYEKEGIRLDFYGSDSDCEYADGVGYYPRYPWEMDEAEKNLTKEKLDEIFGKYFGMKADECAMHYWG